MRKYWSAISVLFVVSCTLLSCNRASEVATAGCPLDTFLNAYIDTTVRPQDDFFRFSMGKWVMNNPVPESERSWGIWSKVNEENYHRMKSINEEAASRNADNGTNWQKIGDFWSTGMDTAAIEQQGIQPLSGQLTAINAITDVNSMMVVVGELHAIGVSALYSSYIYQDEMNSEKMLLHLFQGGIGLPDRDYYFDKDERTKNIRSEYLKHLTKMFTLMGDDTVLAANNAATVMRMETALAESSRKLAALRDPYENYNKMAVGALNKMTPSIPWNNLLAASGIKTIDTLIVGQPEFFKRAEELVKKEPVDNWKIYLRWHLINTYADKLSKPFDLQNFSFYGTVLNGTKAQRPRWKRVLDEEENLIGFMLGELYVERYYSPEVKARYDQMVDYVVEAYRDRINQLDWMSSETKQKALVKLGTVQKKVGYPDKWRDYSSLEIDKSAYATNVMRATRWYHDYEISKLGKPVDRTEWEMTPQTWNAYYNPSNNEIVLPAAAFIVPGMADSCVDDAIMYGYAAGSTIGHEITHGFDDQGSQFDEKGNLVEWWTKDDRTRFLERTATIVTQFNEYTVLDSLQVNGDATQGENIADLGGMLLGLDAFKKTEQYKKGEKIGGFTPVQRYFIGFALSWYGQYRPEALAVRIKTDVHAPNFLRVNGPPVNIDEFYTAFNVQPGDKMYRPDSLRVSIW